VTLHEPELLLLDEPTSGIDTESRRELWDDLFELAETGTTILVSTHFMDEAERCHRLAILTEGHLVVEGEPRDLSAEIDAVVLEIETDDPRRARAALRSLSIVHAVTQLGKRLHVMVDHVAENPEQQVQSTLVAAELTGRVERVAANLEDVFVASTSFYKRDKAKVLLGKEIKP
jgi:ABC-2 type transport system ATP-binding protein